MIGRLFILVLLVSCTPKENSAGDTKASGTASGVVTSLVYEAATHSLKIGFDYQGCGETKHTLEFSNVCAESYPQQCSAQVMQANYDGTCMETHHEDLLVTLKTEQDEMVLQVKSKEGKGLSVLVDRTGRVKAATTPSR
jgi:hypothetical protein